MTDLKDLASAETTPEDIKPKKRPFGKRLRSFARKWWHQLTSMRTALFLLLALAFASIPGSTFPQRTIAPEKVNQFYTENPTWAPILDRLWAFDVYSSPWFSAIYLLLMVSLIGCITPRLIDIARQLRQRIPNAPKRFDILTYHRKTTLQQAVDVDSPQKIDVEAARKVLKSNRWRTTIYRDDEDDAGTKTNKARRIDADKNTWAHEDSATNQNAGTGTVTIAAEKGYTREVGNLAFHISIVLLLIGMGIGSMFTWYGYRILSEGEQQSFCNNLQQYDEYGLGTYVSDTSLPNFCLTLNDFDVEFEGSQPTYFNADVSYTSDEGSGQYDLQVNHPLNFGSTNVFLIGQGYTPVVTFTDKYGNETTLHTPFLPADSAMNSEGAFKFPDSNIDPETGEQDAMSQVGFDAFLVPTYAGDGVDSAATGDDAETTRQILGTDPNLKNPVLALLAYEGDLGMDSGTQSVYSLNDTYINGGLLERVDDSMVVIGLGDTYELPDGSSLSFDDVENYAVLQVRSDPAQVIVLGAAVILMVSLLPMLIIRRRRFWVRLHSDGTVEYGGLPRAEYDAFADECNELVEEISGQPIQSITQTPSQANSPTGTSVDPYKGSTS